MPNYDAVLKTRIPEAWLREMEKQAEQEGLKVPDITRRAIRMMLGRKAAIPRKGSK